MNKLKLNVNDFAWYTFNIFILVKAFTGPLTLFLPYIRFLPIAMMIILLGYKILKNIVSKSGVILFIMFVIIYVALGIINNSLIASVFGIYIFVPFLFAFFYCDVLYERVFFDNVKFNFIYFLSCAAGIFYVSQFGAAWIGAEQEIGGVTKVVSRDWVSNGMIRNPGFTGGSVSSATFISITFAFIGFYLVKKRRLITFAALFALSSYLVYLTTTKTTMVTLGLVFALVFCSSFITRYAVKILFLLLAVFSYYCMFSINNVSTGMLANTMLIRIYQTWPNAMLLLENSTQYFLGKGFGSIGVPTYYFNPSMANSADNMFVYLYVLFGVPSVLLVFYGMIKFIYFKMESPRDSKEFFIILIVVLSGGITSNLFEASFYSVYAGIIIGMILTNRMSVKS